MSRKIKKILNKLYSIDDGLKDYEKELKKFIGKLVDVYPPTKFDDDDFLRTLHKEVVDKEYDFEKIVKKIDVTDARPVSGFRMVQSSYRILGGIMLAVILMTAVTYYFFDGSISAPVNGSFSSLSVSDAKSEAFGSFENIFIEKNDNYTQDKFVFKEKELVFELENMPVLKRVFYAKGQFNAESIFKDFSNFDPLDPTLFRDEKLDTIFFSENRGYGYSVLIDMKNGSVNIAKNKEKWSGDSVCGDGACASVDNKRVLDVANSFVKAYDIDLASYSDGVVVKRWRSTLGGKPENNSSSEFDTASVLYPLNINGKKVYDNTGHEFGIIVDVDLGSQRVSGVHNLYANSYESSIYDFVSDKDAILKYAERGGLGHIFSGGSGAVEMGAPENVYIRMMSTGKNSDHEFLIPALSFPVLNKEVTDQDLSGASILVPLVKDVFERTR